MNTEPAFDTAKAHRYFAVSCFNAAWNFIERSARTAEEDEQMIRLAQASLWHWTQRDDCTDRNRSIGYWQLARVYAVADRSEDARRYAQLCLQATPTDDPFCLGYAHEALARGELLAGNREAAGEHLTEARRLTELVTDADDRQVLVDDLNSLIT